jgi:hypothetical protein
MLLRHLLLLQMPCSNNILQMSFGILTTYHKLLMSLAKGGSAIVKCLHHHPIVEDLSLDATESTGREKISKTNNGLLMRSSKENCHTFLRFSQEAL